MKDARPERRPPLFILSGAPGSGKTSVAHALLQHFPLGLHIPMDDLREWVVSGRASIYNWNDETTRQFELARQSAADTARRYLEAGFAVVIDDVLFPDETERLFLEPLADFTTHRILLAPGLEVALDRNARRTNKAFDTAALTDIICSVRKALDEQPFAETGWLVIDSSEQTLEQTVRVILERHHGEGRE